MNKEKHTELISEIELKKDGFKLYSDIEDYKANLLRLKGNLLATDFESINLEVWSRHGVRNIRVLLRTKSACTNLGVNFKELIIKEIDRIIEEAPDYKEVIE